MALSFPPKTETTTICASCNKRPATKLCDFPLRHCRYIGHPPRHLMLQAKSDAFGFKEVNMSWTMTCDKPLCDQCAISMNCDIDFCPSHIKELLAKQKAHKTQK